MYALPYFVSSHPKMASPGPELPGRRAAPRGSVSP